MENLVENGNNLWMIWAVVEISWLFIVIFPEIFCHFWEASRASRAPSDATKSTLYCFFLRSSIFLIFSHSCNTWCNLLYEKYVLHGLFFGRVFFWYFPRRWNSWCNLLYEQNLLYCFFLRSWIFLIFFPQLQQLMQLVDWKIPVTSLFLTVVN